jgi:hypothetical protein
LLINHCLQVVPDPTLEEINTLGPVAERKDLPILAAALYVNCAFLTTYNLRHYQPGLPGIVVLKPGDLVLRVRYLLSQLHSGIKDDTARK